MPHPRHVWQAAAEKQQNGPFQPRRHTMTSHASGLLRGRGRGRGRGREHATRQTNLPLTQATGRPRTTQRAPQHDPTARWISIHQQDGFSLSLIIIRGENGASRDRGGWGVQEQASGTHASSPGVGPKADRETFTMLELSSNRSSSVPGTNRSINDDETKSGGYRGRFNDRQLLML